MDLSSFVRTFIPSVGFLIQEAARTLSPSIETMHALQLPSALYPGLSAKQRWGSVMPSLLATLHIVSSSLATTFLLLRKNSTIIYYILSLK